MTTEPRQNLDQNELAEWIGQSYQQVKPYSKTLVASLVAIVVIGSVIWFLANQSKAKRAAAWTNYFAAIQASENQEEIEKRLNEVATKYPGAPAAFWAKLYLADQNLTDGVNLLFTDRTESGEKLKAALDGYSTVLQNSRDSQSQERAAWGVAQAAESLAELDKAKEHYKKVVEQWPTSIYAPLAKKRLEDLDRPATVSFYDWFASFEPPKASELPGVPGQRPDFEALPDSMDAPGGILGGGFSDSLLNIPGLTPETTPDTANPDVVNPDGAMPEATGPLPEIVEDIEIIEPEAAPETVTEASATEAAPAVSEETPATPPPAEATEPAPAPEASATESVESVELPEIEIVEEPATEAAETATEN